MGLKELEQSTIEVRRRGRVGLREKLRVSTDTGASAGLTARIVASTNLTHLHGELFGDVESSFLPQRPDVTLEGELNCPASARSASKPSLSSSYEQEAMVDQALLYTSLSPSEPAPSLSVCVVTSAVARKGFVGLVSSVKPIRLSDAGNEAAFGEALGGVESAILLMCLS